MKHFAKFACVAILVAMSGAARAQGLTPADNKALYDYVLSMDKVKAMQAAMDDYHAAAAKDPSLEAQTKDVADGQSIAQMEALFARSPKLMAIYSRHGITSADAVLMPGI